MIPPKIYFFQNDITLYISFCSFAFLLNITFLRSILIIRYQPNIFLSTTLAVFFQLCWLSSTVRNMWSSSHLWICKTETKISPSIYPLWAMHSVIFYSLFHTVSKPTKLIYWPTNGLSRLFYFILINKWIFIYPSYWWTVTLLSLIFHYENNVPWTLCMYVNISLEQIPRKRTAGP